MSLRHRFSATCIALVGAVLLSACSAGTDTSPAAAGTADVPVAAAPAVPQNDANDAAPAVESAPVVALITVPIGSQAAVDLAVQIAQWQRDQVISDGIAIEYDASIQPAEETPLFQSFALLNFADEAAYQAWSGGAAAVVGAQAQVHRADRLVGDESPTRDLAAQVFVINHYAALVARDAYTAYTRDYIVPNMANQKDSGVMTGYAMYLEREPVDGRQRAVLVKEYLDADAFVRSDAIKDAHKQVLLDTNPAWKQINDTKEAIRSDLNETVARAKAP